MYLAEVKNGQKAVRFVIRQSVKDGDRYRSRDLFDLGDDPSRYIVYPGGNGFYIDPAVESTIEKQGAFVSQSELEPLFRPFLPFRIRRVIEGFDRSVSSKRKISGRFSVKMFHPFDLYRLHYLKFGSVNPRHFDKVPHRFYAGLFEKSRDEIEYDFISAEQILQQTELAHYTFQIFNLHRHFDTHFARSYPESLDQRQLDRFFIKALCDLNEDESFQLQDRAGTLLHPHLARYAIMYFDNCFLPRDPFQSFLRDFINRHRVYQPPKSVQVSLSESAQLFGVSVAALKKMNAVKLTRIYRKMAMKHHPDRGGDPNVFVKLNEAYNKLMKRKGRH